MDCTYEARKCTNLRESLDELIELGAAGVSISMPYKHEIVKYLSYTDVNVQKFQSCNTVIFNGERMYGANTDCAGAEYALTFIRPTDKVSVLGNGSMGTMFATMLGSQCNVYARNLRNWEDRYDKTDVYINCTPYGTLSDDTPLMSLGAAALVIDLAINPNQLEQQCQTSCVKYVAGIEFYKRQFIAQFETYTGKQLTYNEL
jgi:shikimate dehydrogenase